MDLLMVIGAGIFQVPAIKIARGMGLGVLACDIDPHAPGFEFADFKALVSTKDVDGNIKEAKKYDNIKGVMTIGTDVSYTVACVAKAMGLPGIDPQTAFCASNKFAMRERLHQKGVPCPKYFSCSSYADAVKGINDITGYTCVIKPVDNMGARGVQKLSNEIALRDAFDVACQNSATGSVIIEQFMEGPEISMDTLVYDGEVHLLTVADRHIVGDPYFIEIGHTIPSVLPPEVLREAFEFMKKAIKAIGIDNGASKSDMKITAEGPRIGEITARMSGGFHCQYTDPLATGMNSIRAAINIALGKEPDIKDITPHFNRAAAERCFLPEEGRVKEIKGVQAAKDIPGVEEIFINLRPGDIYKHPKNNIGKAGHVIISGKDREEAINAAKMAMKTVEFVMY